MDLKLVSEMLLSLSMLIWVASVGKATWAVYKADSEKAAAREEKFFNSLHTKSAPSKY